ncbi:extracellular solute-binding protein [Amycolatopsis cihanbeyliensis]|uniref:Carbohydrate ABC transporter substrate-binding protein (CUT1 family) n=1 Tax=Amycolatopsis cihanbeyliensis TaxID=1128664 RepID=A0A542DEJ4_AMYCI|nr:extracellular solute-binding protein [Amycolatopsis cihanbeyliensis]TQJ01497.1 carbohydrate ABC transporter substrate-binding protein (CUT1 family) [Amycolatopsis cihanbeyliensis]
MRITRTIAAVMLTALAAAACSPPQSDPAAEGGDQQTGPLRVWLFDEANRAPKEAVVQEAIKEFEAAHDGVTVDVQWVAVETRADKFSGAFNDPANAPDVAEFGNTDVASYAETGALADLTADIESWSAGEDLLPSVLETAKVDGKTYGLPWFTGIRALYYRTDVFDELGLQPPRTLAELTETAREVRAAKPEMYGISVGGKYTYAMLPFLWAHGGELAEQQGDRWQATVDSEEARAGVTAYTDLIKPDICPPEQCADMTGTQSVQAFAGGQAAMTVGGDFNHKAIEEGLTGKYDVVPLPGTEQGSIAPAFAGGNLLGVFQSSQRGSLAVEFIQLLGSAEYQSKMYEAMGNLPTLSSLQRELSASEEFLEPFVTTLQSGTKFVPSTPAWSLIDAQQVLPTAAQQIVTGQQQPDAALADAAQQMNDAFNG